MKPEKAARKRRLTWRRILLLLAVLLLAVAAYFIESRSGQIKQSARPIGSLAAGLGIPGWYK